MIPKRIVIIGSSSAEGKVDPENGGFTGRLRRWAEKLNEGNHVYNLAISGNTTGEMLTRLVTEAKPRRPELIIIQHGLNDTIHLLGKDNPVRTPLATFIANVEKLIAQARTFSDVIVLSVYPVDEAKTTPFRGKDEYFILDDAKKYAQAAKDLCSQMKVPYIDVFNEWLAMDYKKYIHTDGLHANAAGHQNIFEALKDFLEKQYL